jgi:nickel-dependent lactate racemase
VELYLHTTIRFRLSRNEMWTPHLYIVNEQESEVMGTDRKDVMVTVDPNGTVTLSTRSRAS